MKSSLDLQNFFLNHSESGREKHQRGTDSRNTMRRDTCPQRVIQNGEQVRAAAHVGRLTGTAGFSTFQHSCRPRLLASPSLEPVHQDRMPQAPGLSQSPSHLPKFPPS